MMFKYRVAKKLQRFGGDATRALGRCEKGRQVPQIGKVLEDARMAAGEVVQRRIWLGCDWFGFVVHDATLRSFTSVM
jgi:hypothetical protein